MGAFLRGERVVDSLLVAPLREKKLAAHTDDERSDEPEGAAHSLGDTSVAGPVRCLASQHRPPLCTSWPVTPLNDWCLKERGQEMRPKAEYHINNPAEIGRSKYSQFSWIPTRKR